MSDICREAIVPLLPNIEVPKISLNPLVFLTLGPVVALDPGVVYGLERIKCLAFNVLTPVADGIAPNTEVFPFKVNAYPVGGEADGKELSGLGLLKLSSGALFFKFGALFFELDNRFKFWFTIVLNGVIAFVGYIFLV